MANKGLTTVEENSHIFFTAPTSLSLGSNAVESVEGLVAAHAPPRKGRICIHGRQRATLREGCQEGCLAYPYDSLYNDHECGNYFGDGKGTFEIGG
jgi:hypothetical protein